jgi:hypothetical protein
LARFADALDSNTAPSSLGDVTLRYEPSMLIGETRKPAPSIFPSLWWLLGLALLLAVACGTALELDLNLLILFAVLGASAIAWAMRLGRAHTHQRRFILNFTTASLRLDFASLISGYPRTLVVNFEAVRVLTLASQVDGQLCLVVDFEYQGRILEEVLAAYIPQAQRPQAERLERVLFGAFGLGGAPKDDSGPPHDQSTFEPAGH